MASFFFPSNTTVNGTNGDDSMVGTASGGNTNDLIYGHQGNDTITFDTSVSNSVMFGGQGDDIILAVSGSQNVIYGNRGNDTLESVVDTNDTIFGGQDNDVIEVVLDTSSAVYGNQGNDEISGADNQSSNYFGGQGNDTIDDVASNLSAIYGNQGNDLLIGVETVNSHMYGGLGDDTLLFEGGTTNDAMTGGQGNDLFVTSAGSFGASLNASDIVTVTDFLSGSDQLALTDKASVGLFKINGSGDNAAQALTAADNFYASNPGSEYVFVYGGTGAGYLFYNGDTPTTFATAGFALTGNNGENSVKSSDIVTSSFA